MSKLFKSLFGGIDDSAQKGQIRQNQQVLELQAKLAAQARGDIMDIFPGVRQSAQEGFQGALDIYGQSVPQQARLLQEGNIAAQNTLLAGLPQQNAAILGQRVDLSGLAPTRQSYSTDFMQQQLPERTAMPSQETGVGGMTPQQLSQMLAGLNITGARM